MAGQELKASEKKVLKMTKDGVIKKNLVTDKSERVSKLAEEAVLKKEVTPVLLAKYKAAGLENSTESKRQFRKLQFGKNNPENQRNEDENDNQQSEQTLSVAMPVVSISFVPKNDVSEFSTKEIKKQRKVRQKQDRQLEKNKNTEDYVENPEDSPDIEVSEEPKLKENKPRNALEEHSSAVENLKEESEDSRLTFEDGADDVITETKLRRKTEDIADSDISDTIADSNDNASVSKPSADKKLEKKVSKDEKKLSKVEKKLEKAEKKLPKERVVTFEKKLDPKKGKYKRKLRFETEVKPSDREYFFSKPVKNAKSVVKNEVSSIVHGKISEYEEDNLALKAAHSTEKVGESALHTAKSAIKTVNQSQLKAPYKNVSKLKFKKEQTEKKLSYHKALSEKPEMRSDKSKNAVKEAMKKSQQKQNQKKAAKETKKAAEKVKEVAEDVGRKIVEMVASNKWVIIIVVIFLMVFAIFGTLCTSCSSSFVDNGTVFIATSYTAKEEDIYAANDHLTNLENGLTDYINHIPDYYVGWSEYNYHLDNIGHDPYQLISFLSSMKINFTYDADTQNKINEIYNEMYDLNVVSTHEVRSNTYTEVDEDGNETVVTVSYDYYILDVYLEAKDFETIVKPKLEAAGVYDLYLAMKATKGNKPDLF